MAAAAAGRQHKPPASTRIWGAFGFFSAFTFFTPLRYGQKHMEGSAAEEVEFLQFSSICRGRHEMTGALIISY
jgi:hypothetical protein